MESIRESCKCIKWPFLAILNLALLFLAAYSKNLISEGTDNDNTETLQSFIISNERLTLLNRLFGLGMLMFTITN